MLSPPPSAVAAPPLPRTGRGGPLANPDFRWLCLTQLATGLRMPMTFMTQTWYVASAAPESRRVLLLGLLATLNGLAFLSYVLFGGAFADRYPRRLTLYVAHGGAFAAAATTGLLLMMPGASEGSGAWLPFFMVTFALFGVINAQDLPARTAMIRDVVLPTNLTRAVTIFQLCFAMTMVGAGLLAGTLIERLGFAPAYLVASSWHLVILFALWRMRLVETAADPGASGQSVLANVREGWHHLDTDAAVRWTILVTWVGVAAGVSVMGILVAAWVSDVLELDAQGWGWLQMGWGLGGALGAALLAWRGEYGRKGLLFLGLTFVFGLCVLGFGLSRAVVLAWLFNALAGGAFQLMRVLGIAIVQSSVPNRLLGRVMGLLILAQGIAQGSGLLFGSLGQAIGLELMFPLAGIGIMLLALSVFAAQEPLRRLN
ncbi:MAG: MFS transporter [Dehalococcoidia bacterium]